MEGRNIPGKLETTLSTDGLERGSKRINMKIT